MKQLKSSALTLVVLFILINHSHCKNINCNVKTVNLHMLELTKVVSCEFYRAIVKVNDTIDIVFNYHQKGVLENSTSEEVADLVTHIKFRNSNLALIPNRIFSQFPNLKIYDASHSKLKSISSLSFNNSNLTHIFLYHNKLAIIRDYVFVHCPEVLILDLSQNEISTIEKFAFVSLSKLEKLDLSMNKIKSLKDGTFDNLTALNFLWLSRNEIGRISANLFGKSNENLMTLFMDYNHINSISPNAFENLKNLRFLFLTGNNCTNKDFKNHVIHDNIAIAYELKECHKTHRRIYKHETNRNLSAIIAEINDQHAKCQSKVKLKSDELKLYEVAIQNFAPSTVGNVDEDAYYEEE